MTLYSITMILSTVSAYFFVWMWITHMEAVQHIILCRLYSTVFLKTRLEALTDQLQRMVYYLQSTSSFHPVERNRMLLDSSLKLKHWFTITCSGSGKHRKISLEKRKSRKFLRFINKFAITVLLKRRKNENWTKKGKSKRERKIGMAYVDLQRETWKMHFCK